MGVVLGLYLLLVRRVREHDAALGLATSKLDALSPRSLSSLQELQRSHETFLHVFSVQFPLALGCFTCVYVLKQVDNYVAQMYLNKCATNLVLILLDVRHSRLGTTQCVCRCSSAHSAGFPLVCVLTACGASCCYLLSKNLASEEIVLSVSERLLPGKLHALRQKIDDARAQGQLPFLLLFLRVFPFTPNWFLNMASPWLQVPLKLFAPSVAVGLLPYNFITVHAGAMLSSLRSTSDLLDPRTMGLLVLLAVGMLIPALLKKKAKAQEAKNSQKEELDVDERSSKKTD